MFKKKTILILSVGLLLSIVSLSQPIICSSSEIALPAFTVSNLSSNQNMNSFNIGDIYLNESFSWRNKYNAYNEEKNCYYSHSLYIKDSEIGLRVASVDFNPFYEKFETYSLNQFARRNKMRIRFSLLMEYYPFDNYYINAEDSHVFSKIETYYGMINMDMSIRYTHLSRTARGDNRTMQRKGSWGFVIWGDLKRRYDFMFKVKTGKYVWVVLDYKKEYSGKKMSFLTEIQLNKYGFSHATTESSKDLYKGLSIIIGPEYNLTRNYYSLNVGVRYNYRNH